MVAIRTATIYIPMVTIRTATIYIPMVAIRTATIYIPMVAIRTAGYNTRVFILPAELICIFCLDLKINSDYFPVPCWLLSAFEKLRKATVSFVMALRLSVRLSTRNNSAPTGRIFMKFNV
jgi:hypothetical protein